MKHEIEDVKIDDLTDEDLLSVRGGDTAEGCTGNSCSITSDRCCTTGVAMPFPQGL